jgi:hypothetical protein
VTDSVGPPYCNITIPLNGESASQKGLSGANTLEISVIQEDETKSANQVIHVFLIALQQRYAFCLCCLAQVGIERSQQQLVAAGELQVSCVIHGEAVPFAKRKNLFGLSGGESWFLLDGQPREFFPEELRLSRFDAPSADSHQESVCNFGGPVRRDNYSIALP